MPFRASYKFSKLVGVGVGLGDGEGDGFDPMG